MNSNNYTTSGSGHVVKKAFVATSILVASGTTFAGSGGSPASTISFESQKNTTSIAMIINSNKDINNDVSRQLNFIKDTFLLSDEELSKACGVASRKTLSNWKEKGEIARDSSRQRTFKLFLLSKDWQDQNFPKDKSSLTKLILDDQSVFSMLQENSLDSQKVLFAGRRLLRQSLKTNSTELL